ncbi:MAG TPA: HAD family hydrolase [Gemmatimonadales bacterium]|jgi:FMN phosphatase YigB (HAD superfamily)|nr:HAD family hydrolase [Gemmatimonadales bacterium]
MLSRVVFLLDVDNTLLDNDRIIDELRQCLTRELGAERQRSYWDIFEDSRARLGYADYLGTLQRYRLEDPGDPHLVAISAFLLNYPFAQRLYPGALEVIKHLDGWGTTIILTDGDVVFQPLKISRSGLSDAVNGRVLIYVHKEQSLADVERRYPADHYVMVDDKVRLLAAMKQVWGDRLTTVFPRQGHYARNPEIARYPPPDFSIERIGALLDYDPPPGVARTG